MPEIITNCPKYIAWLLLCFFYASAAAAPAAENSDFSKQQLEWLESDEEHPTAEVNEGELEFLPGKANKPEHQHDNHLWISQQTISTGWAKLDQCHTNLDAVPDLQIVYHKDRIRNLKIISRRNIAEANVEGHRVVLHNISRHSRICLQAYSRVFWPTTEGHYVLSNGPFMRKFLDGYYPLKVSLNVHYPESLLKLIQIRPAPQTGWEVQYRKNTVILSGRFEGELRTHLLFKHLKNP